jgi:three-Cys-motif partner protein
VGRELVYGRDGLIAREAGDYARKKLAFIEFFAPPAIDATERKVHRFYIDLFAGPGLNVVRETKEEIEAGALTILRSRGHRRPDLSFTHAHLVNLDPADHQALRSRVDRLVAAHLCMVPAGNIEHHLGDANFLTKKLLAHADKRDYVLVFADIEAPRQLPWETVRSLRTYGHESVDLYILFPLEMGLNRLTSYQEMQPGHAEIITRFYGDETWRPILSNRISGNRSSRAT